MRKQGSGTRCGLLAALAAAGCDPAATAATMTLPSNEASPSAERAGAGIATSFEHVAPAAESVVAGLGNRAT